jgi:hypothetical protein
LRESKRCPHPCAAGLIAIHLCRCSSVSHSPDRVGSRIDFGKFETEGFKTEETFFLPVIASDVNRIIRVLATIDKSAFDKAYGAPLLPKNSFEHGTRLIIVDAGSGVAAQRTIRLPPYGPLSAPLSREVEATALFGLASALSDYQRGEKLLADRTYLIAAEDLTKAAREMRDWIISYHGRFWDRGFGDFNPTTARIAGFDLVLTYEASSQLWQQIPGDQRSQFQHIAEAERQTCESFMSTEGILREQRKDQTIVSFRQTGRRGLQGDGGAIQPPCCASWNSESCSTMYRYSTANCQHFTRSSRS